MFSKKHNDLRLVIVIHHDNSRGREGEVDGMEMADISPVPLLTESLWRWSKTLRFMGAAIFHP